MIADTVTASELARKLKRAKTTILRRADKQEWPHRNGGNRVKRFYVNKLPSDIQEALAGKADLAPELIPSLAPAAALVAAQKRSTVADGWKDGGTLDARAIKDPNVTRWARIVQEAMDVPAGWKKRKWVEAVALKHGTTFQTVYRKMKRYRDAGLAGLRHTKANGAATRKWTPEAVDYWVGLVLKQEHRKVAKDALYAILEQEARRRGWEIGGYRSALWWIDKRVTPQLLALQRGGLRALDNLLPPVVRDYSDLAPFEILVGDQHRFDFWVIDDETGDVIRPEGYFWQDLRTRCFYGGALDRKYDSYLIGLALRMGLKIFGAFDAIYTDNGKPELSRYVMGIMKDMRTLGLRAEREVDVPLETGTDAEETNPLAIMPGTHRKAIVRNAKAKMIEGTFNALEGILRDHMLVPGYVKKLGGSGEENEIDEREVQGLARAGKLLTFWEFTGKLFAAMDYYNTEKAHRGVLKEWRRPKPKAATPMQCLEQCYADGWRPGRISEEAVDLVFMPRARRVVDRGRIAFRRELYEHEALVPLHGRRVEVRFDPLDPETLLVFEGDRFVCLAGPVEYSSMKDKDLAARKIAEKRRRRRGFILEYKRMTSAVPDFRAMSETPAIEAAAREAHRAKELRVRRLEEPYEKKPAQDLAAEVARLEDYRPEDRRPVFATEVERYEWALTRRIKGLGLDPDDEAFTAEFEQRMDADTRDYWDIYKNSIKGGRSR